MLRSGPADLEPPSYDIGCRRIDNQIGTITPIFIRVRQKLFNVGVDGFNLNIGSYPEELALERFHFLIANIVFKVRLPNLLLTKTDGDIENEGSLETREIMNMRLNADLAVLSACETGNGRISPGEGVIGMSWAFFVAGTRSMVVSQWRVNSASTSQLMKDFYQALARQPNRGNKALALNEASVRLRKDARYRHPFYWAGFVLVGNN